MGKFLHDYMLWAAILSLVVLSIVVVWLASGDASYGDHVEEGPVNCEAPCSLRYLSPGISTPARVYWKDTVAGRTTFRNDKSPSTRTITEPGTYTVYYLECVESDSAPEHPRNCRMHWGQTFEVTSPPSTPTPIPTATPTTGNTPTPEPAQNDRRGGIRYLECDAPLPYPGSYPETADCKWAREHGGGTQ